MGMVNVNSPGIHVLTRLISRRDKASDRIMSHGLAPLVHLWKQDPFFFSCLKEDAEWSQIAWTNFLRGMIDLPFEGAQGHTVGREGHVYFCLTVEKIFFRIVASFLEILKMRILFDYLGIINLRTSLNEEDWFSSSLSKIYATAWNLRSNLISQNFMTIRNKP